MGCNARTVNEHRFRMLKKKKNGEEETAWGNFIICSLPNIITYRSADQGTKRQLRISRSRWNNDMNFKDMGREGV
jgi:hypothetical protein